MLSYLKLRQAPQKKTLDCREIAEVPWLKKAWAITHPNPESTLFVEECVVQGHATDI